MSQKNERIQILEMIESGVITADDGARLLRAIDDEQQANDSLDNGYEATGERGHSEDGGTFVSANGDADPISGEVLDETFQPEIEKWKRWWIIPLWIGVGITIIGSLLMFWAYQSTGFSFWFGCAWLPFLMGVAVIAMAWGSRGAVWLHLRVQQEPGEWPRTIAFSFPLPLRFAAWVMRSFGHFIPQVKGIDFDELIQVFERTSSSGTPFYIEVDEGEGGEKVQIYIG